MKKLIVANWKLNPSTLKAAVRLAAAIQKTKRNTVVLCPPTPFLSQVHFPNLGAQDCFWQDQGPYTGQTSPAQLKDLKVKYCIVGHSERRATGDTDEMINAKIHALLKHKLIPILCVGFGTKVEQEDLEVVDVLSKQLKINLLGINPAKVIVAYEPVWAIGTGKNASAEHAEKIALFIKTKFQIPKVLYGGSVNHINAKNYLQQPSIAGLLVGGASLVPTHFNQIINLAVSRQQ